MKRRSIIGSLTLVAAITAACSSTPSATTTTTTSTLIHTPNCPPGDVAGGPTGCYLIPPGIQKVKHVIMIMQENRSFDNYFGTYPGALGIPMRNGVPTVCVPNPATHVCDKPFHDVYDVNGGGPHSEPFALADVDGGKMDGFIGSVLKVAKTCTSPQDPSCVFVKFGGKSGVPDVMGYHTAAEIPNYWTYAKDFVLADHMFEPVKSWSLPDHLYQVSAWSAHCANTNPMSCQNSIMPYTNRQFDSAVGSEVATGTTSIDLAWTDETWLLYHHNVSWGYYVQNGTQPDCANDAALTCPPVPQNWRTPGIWNPLPLFTDVQNDHQEKNVQPLGNFLTQAKSGTLPAVSWIAPSQLDSEHPPGSIHNGQAYVTALINAIMKSPDWSSSAIFLAWDDWGGFYDNVVPPTIDANGYGMRVPAMIISPYAKKGWMDTQTLSSDAFLKFIEDDFLNGARLNPKTDGRPDPRPDVREDASQLGNLANAFDFSQAPRPPMLLPTNPPSDSPDLPTWFKGLGPCDGCTALPVGTTGTGPPGSKPPPQSK
ncbi:MAG TPA: alkaline phosphatase family protein [Acidimicrobiales bacterium]|nr:alkaline phosphatase family protein [Acidimicrobiales bacterium]